LQGNIDDNVTVLDAEDVAIRQSVLDNQTDKVTIGSVGLVTLNISNVTNLVGVASCAEDEKPTNLTINNSGVFLTCVADSGGAGAGNVSGGGTTKYLIMWENTQNITNSPAFVTAQDDVNFTKAIIIGTTSTANLGAIRTNSNNLEFYNGTAWVSVSGGAGAADTTCEDVDCVFDSGDTGYVTVNLDFAGYFNTDNCTVGNVVQNVSINSTGLFVSCVADNTGTGLQNYTDIIVLGASVDYIQFNLTAVETSDEGKMYWSETDGTVSVCLPGGNVCVQIGQEMTLPKMVKNNNAYDIKNGNIVYISGAQGNRLEISLASSNNSRRDQSQMIGMATEDIDAGQIGYVTTYGLVRGDVPQPINTSTFATSTTLYISPSEDGNFTDVVPTAPHFPIQVGVVLTSATSEGVIFFTGGPTDVTLDMVIHQLIVNNNLTAEALCDESSGICYDIDDLNVTYDDSAVRQSIEDNRTGLNNSLPNDYYLQGQIDDQHGDINSSIPIDTLNLTNGNDFYTGVQVNESDDDTIYDDTAVRASILENVTEHNDSLPNSYYLQGQIDELIANTGDNLGNHTANQSLNMGGFNITNIATLKASDGSSISFSADAPFSGMDNAMVLSNNQTLIEGDVAFCILDAIGEKVLFCLQVGKPESGGWGRNSWIRSNDYGITNATLLTDCNFMMGQAGLTPRMGCNTSQLGAGYYLEGSMQIGHFLSIGGGNLTTNGIRVQGKSDYFMQGNDFGISNGSLHVRDFRIELVGVAEGDRGTIFFEDFESGTLGQFDAVTSGGGANEWMALADENCFNDQCARAQGGGGNPGDLRAMESNISTIPFNEINISFDYTTVNLAGNDLLNITVDNNSGEGETEILLITTALSNQSFNVRLNVSEDNASNMTLRFYFNGNSANDKAFINNILLIGTATESTEVNLTVQDAKIKLGDGVCTFDLNGSNPQTLDIGANPNCLVRLFNTTFVTQTVETSNITGDQNIGGNLFVGGIVTSDNMNETIAQIAFNGTNLLTILHTQSLHEDLGIITINNGTWITDNQLQGLNDSTVFGGDVSGIYDSILVETTQGLSVDNITNLNITIDELANYTSDNENITVIDKVITLIAVNLDEMDNSVSAFITNAVSDLTNYFTQTVINTLLGDINSTIQANNNSITNADFYTGELVNESIVPNQREGVNSTDIPNAAGDIGGTHSAGLTIIANAVQEDEIDFTAVTLVDFTNDANLIANDTDGKLLSLNLSDGSLNTIDCINFTNGASWCGT